MEAVGGATRHGLPCRAAPPASSPRAVLMENASLAAFHVKAGSIERALGFIFDTCGSTGKHGMSG